MPNLAGVHTRAADSLFDSRRHQIPRASIRSSTDSTDETYITYLHTRVVPRRSEIARYIVVQPRQVTNIIIFWRGDLSYAGIPDCLMRRCFCFKNTSMSHLVCNFFSIRLTVPREAIKSTNHVMLFNRDETFLFNSVRILQFLHFVSTLDS